VSAGSLKGFGYHFSKRRIIGGNARNCAQTSGALQGFGERFSAAMVSMTASFQPSTSSPDWLCGETLSGRPAQAHRPAPWLWWCRRPQRHWSALKLRASNLRAHILEWAFKFDFAGDADAITRHDRRCRSVRP